MSPTTRPFLLSSTPMKPSLATNDSICVVLLSGCSTCRGNPQKSPYQKCMRSICCNPAAKITFQFHNVNSFIKCKKCFQQYKADDYLPPLQEVLFGMRSWVDWQARRVAQQGAQVQKKL
eukprot:1146874-Pelagomonas_calceolata.AAC.4